MNGIAGENREGKEFFFFFRLVVVQIQKIMKTDQNHKHNYGKILAKFAKFLANL